LEEYSTAVAAFMASSVIKPKEERMIPVAR